MNRLQELIKYHNSKLNSLDKIRKANIHFAFMFACPLAMSFDSQNEKLKMVAQLNHRKEF